jgi:hypothetical protein
MDSHLCGYAANTLFLFRSPDIDTASLMQAFQISFASPPRRLRLHLFGIYEEIQSNGLCIQSGRIPLQGLTLHRL